MRSNVYLSKEFLKYLVENVELGNQVDSLIESKKQANYRVCKNIIGKSSLYVNYTKEDLKQIKEAYKSSTNLDLETKWIGNLIEREAMTFEDSNYFDVSKPGSIKFEGNIDCINETKRQNLIIKGTNYDFESELFSLQLSEEFDNYSNPDNKDNNIIHPCRNIIIVDPYLFVDRFKKRESFIRFLKASFFFDRPVDKHLSIITEMPSEEKDKVRNEKIQEYIRKLSKALSIKEINIAVFRSINKFKGGDRFMVTDYAKINLSHPFDRDYAASGYFYYLGDIYSNFRKVSKVINEIKFLYDSSDSVKKDVVNRTGKIEVLERTIKYGNILNNPLFSKLEK